MTETATKKLAGITSKFGPRPMMGLYATGFLGVGFFLHAVVSLDLGGIAGFLAQTFLLIVAFGAFAWLAMRAGAFVDGLAKTETPAAAAAPAEAKP